MTADPLWAEASCRRLGVLLPSRPPWAGARLGGLWSTLRTDYSEQTLPAGFEVRILKLPSGRRRVASSAPGGPPLIILPGLYAALGEALFAKVAGAAAASGFCVTLVEDRLAAGTLRLNGPRLPPLAALGEDAAEVARLTGGRPDALALSAGCASALSAPAGTFRRVVAWSAAIDPLAVYQHHLRGPAGWYFWRVHQRAFRRAGLPSPPRAALLTQLLPAERPLCHTGPLLLVHAEDDPVAPVRSIRALPLGPGQRLCVLRTGGHLGFRCARGPSVYLLPFLDEAGSPQG